MTYDRNRQQALKAYREKQENITRLIEGIRGKLEADAKQRTSPGRASAPSATSRNCCGSWTSSCPEHTGPPTKETST